MKEIKEKIVNGKAQKGTLDAYGVIIVKGRIFVPRVDSFIQNLLAESHCSRYSIYPVVTKMYGDFKLNY